MKTRYECPQPEKENIVAYILNDVNCALVLNTALEKFMSDTAEYGMTYVSVNDFDSACFALDASEQILGLFKGITWIDDDFLNDENIEFDFEAFARIDEGIQYMNPKHFSVRELVDNLKNL